MNWKYTDDDLLKSAQQHKTIGEWRRENIRHYDQALRRGMMPEIRKFLAPEAGGVEAQLEDADILAHAAQFQNRRDWRAASEELRLAGQPSPFNCAIRRGRDFFSACTAHMDRLHRQYSDEDLLASARKFQTRGEWKLQDRNACEMARLRPIWDECVAHMRPAANPFAKDYTVYAYEFSDRHVYVGLSVVPENRKLAHASRGPVFSHTLLCSDPVYKTLATGLSFTEAIAAEGEWQADYETKGWLALHKAKAGSLGSIKTASKWTKEAVLADAKRFATKQAWIDGSQGSYRIAKREGWFEEASAHMPKRVLGIGAGVPKTADAKEKMRQAKLGRPQSVAAKAAKSEAIRKWWAARRAPTAESIANTLLEK